MPNYEKMLAAFDTILPAFNALDYAEMLPIICTLIDTAAGRDDRKGYELIHELLPTLEAVGDEFGVLA